MRILTPKEKSPVIGALRHAADSCRRSATTLRETDVVIPKAARDVAARQMDERATEQDRLAAELSENVVRLEKP